jgi:hypothetical protein
MHCTNCGNALNEGDKFCASCGTPLGSREPRPTGHQNASHRHRRKYHKPAQTHQEQGANPTEKEYSPRGRNEAGVTRFNELIAEKAKRKRMILWPISALLAAWTLFELGFLDGFFFIFFAFILFLIGLARPTLSHSLYTSIPGTATNRDKPRCVHCGHIGIYVHGKYKTNTTFHDCSSCGKNLYTS